MLERDAWQLEMARRGQRLERIQARGVQGADFEACRRNFFTWLGNYGWMYNPHADRVARSMVPFVPWDSQIALMLWLLERLEAFEDAYVCKSKKVGATWLAVHYCWWGHRFVPSFSALLGSRTEDQVDRAGDLDSLFEKLRMINRRQPSWIRLHQEDGYVDKHLVLANPAIEAQISGESANPEFGRGDRRTVVVFDEAAALEPRIFRGAYKALEAVARSVWWIYNPPARKSHPVYVKQYEAPASRVLLLDWTTDPTRPKNFKTLTTLPEGRLTKEEFAELYECQAGADKSGSIWDPRWSTILYNELPPEQDTAHANVLTWPLYGGWDFGTGKSYTVCLLALVELLPDVRIWVEHALQFSRVHYQDVAERVLEKMELYGAPTVHFGDPSGKSPTHGLGSWVTDLQGEGVPVVGLQSMVDPRVMRRHPHVRPDEMVKVNGSKWRDGGIITVQLMMDDGRLRIHERCRKLIDAVDNWIYNTSPGVEVHEVHSDYVSPRKDWPSHAGDALLQLVTGVIHDVWHQRQAGGARDQVVVPPTEAGRARQAAEKGGLW